MSIDSVNPYAPPAAEVQDVAHVRAHVETPWFAVSVAKLLVMNVFTLTFYQFFWVYKQWVAVQRRENTSIVPLARAFFTLFFIYQLFGKVADSERDLTGTSRLPAGALGIAWILCALIWRAPDPYGLIALLISPILTLPVQAAANRANAVVAPDQDRNARFTVWNWLLMGPGVILLLLALIGRFLPE